MRHIDLEEVLSYSLSPVPPSLGNYEGSMVKTNKAGLLHCLLKHVPNAVVSTPPSAQTLIVDAIALLQEIQNIPRSFGLLEDQILRQLLSIADRFKCRRIDFVADTYPNKSIKMQERDRRAYLGCQVIHIYSADQNTPHQFRKFMSCGKNKFTSYFISGRHKFSKKISASLSLMVKLLLENESFIKTFSILGQSWLLSDDGFIALEVLCVCCMVNHNAQISTVHGTISFAQA